MKMPSLQQSHCVTDYTPVPMVVKQTPQGERAFDLFSRMLDDRIVFLNEQFHDGMASIICAQLLYLDNLNHDPIQLYINSPGGVVTSGMAIYDTMQFIKSPVSTVCMGMAASMGSFILMAGEKGQRVALRHAKIMIHQPSGGYQGQASDIAIHAEDILKTRKLMYGLYAEHCGKSPEFFARKMERDCYLNAEEALEMGLIDRIVTRRS